MTDTITTPRATVQQALEVLENSIDLVSHEARNAEELYEKYPTRLARIQGLVAFEVAHEKAIIALREALAQPEQEPVAWEQFYPDIGKPQIAFNAEVVGYVAPQRTWVGLTDEDVKHLYPYGRSVWGRETFEAIEAALKKKNT